MGRGGVLLVINYEYNGKVNERVWRIRSSRISALSCADAAVLWRDSSSDHKDTMNDKDDDKDAAWEPA